MRLIMISAPAGKGDDVAQIAFSVGIETVSRRQIENQHPDGKIERKDVVDLATSTPKGKRFIDVLLSADFYQQEDFTVHIRQPRSIISEVGVEEMTKPLVEPSIDLFEESWQFSHITYGLIGRILISGGLLAYGLIEHQILLIIAGLLFLPLLPILLAAGFSIWTGKWKLFSQAGLAFLMAAVLLLLSGVFIASICEPPIKFDEFNSLPVSFLISLAVGIAAGLASIDDAGRRELIGLAAAAQIAIIPVWFGICLILGFPKTIDESEITNRLLIFLVNVLTIIIASTAVFVLTKIAHPRIGQIKE
jgi:hypothetical protein